MTRAMTYSEAFAMLPPNAKWSSTFGNPGEGGFVEYWHEPNGQRWIISNGPWHLIEPEFDWHCQKVEGIRS